MNCPKCNLVLSDNDQFCPKCHLEINKQDLNQDNNKNTKYNKLSYTNWMFSSILCAIVSTLFFPFSSVVGVLGIFSAYKVYKLNKHIAGIMLIFINVLSMFHILISNAFFHLIFYLWYLW